MKEATTAGTRHRHDRIARGIVLGILPGILPAFLLLLVAGCAEVWYDQYWTKPGGTEAGFDRDASECDQSALSRYPPLSLGAHGQYGADRSFCTLTPGGPNCVLINPGYLPQARAADDSNAFSRERDYQFCLMARGWRPVTAEPGFAAVPPHLGAPPGGLTARNPTARPAPSRDRPRAARAWCEAHLKRQGARAVAADRMDQCIVERVNQSAPATVGR